MKIKKKIIVLIISFLSLFFLIGFLYFYIEYEKPKEEFGITDEEPKEESGISNEEPKEESGITDEEPEQESGIIKFSFPITPYTFSLPLTPYTQKYMNLRLQAIKCTPDQYYQDSSQICFICGNFDVCLEYGLVQRTGGEMMSIRGESLAGDYDMETELNFESYGIFELLSCKCDEECICDDGTKAILEEPNPIFVFPENINLENKIKEIGQGIGKECSSTDMGFECGWLGVLILDKNRASFEIII